MSKKKRKEVFLVLGKFRKEESGIHDSKKMYRLHFRKGFKTIKIWSIHSFERITDFIRKHPYTVVPIVCLVKRDNVYYFEFPFGMEGLD